MNLLEGFRLKASRREAVAEREHIVQAITKPLQFASKNGFANLPQVKGLERLISGLGNKALSLELDPSQKQLFRELLEVFTGFERASMEEKKERIARSMRIMMELEGKVEGEGRRENEELRIKSEEGRREGEGRRENEELRIKSEEGEGRMKN
jgi:hypothetical protein